MKTTYRFFSIVAMALLLTAPNAAAQSHDKAGHHSKTAEHDDVLQAELVDGVQVAEIEIGKMGYSAKRVALQADVPARLVFTRTIDGGCALQIQIPDLGVEPTDVPLNEPTPIEFTPEEEGEYTFACGMDMMKGTLLVTHTG